ncbi:MAG: hypothetical protein LLH30_17140 [Candidatus Manganitrophus sp. SA1]|nr:hypothetical protein [Candidatus Manganitrophus morganii]
MNINEIRKQAKALTKEERKSILTEISEIQLHGFLKGLFGAMEPECVTEITHGVDEFGKDLVIVKRSKLSTDVFGVVVKVGDIRAKTAGKVDDLKSVVSNLFSSVTTKKIAEMASQVEQAFNHPAEMKTIFPKLPVSKVFVVLAGEMSRQARQRLEQELKENMARIEIRDIDWLIDNFTEYYPQAFFEGRIIDFIQDKIQNLESKHWLSTKGKNLSEYFIEPIVSVIPGKDDLSNFEQAMTSKFVSFPKLREILTHKRKILLIGDPVAGKSGALAKLTIDMLRESSPSIHQEKGDEKKIEIPILVVAKDILDTNTPEEIFRKFVPEELEHRFLVKVLMVDALDEVHSTNRMDVIEKARVFSEKYSCPLVVTSRKIDIVKQPPKDFEAYELMPFRFSQALKLFQKLVSSQKTLSSLKDGLDRIKNQIPMVPLSLMFLIDLVEENKEIPASVTELYDRFYDMALGRWDKEKGIIVLFEYLIKKRFLAGLAYHEFLKKQQLEITKEDFDAYLKNYADRFDMNQESLPDFIREIERAGILEIREQVFFRHRSFLDYFIAFYIFDRREEFQDLNDFIVKIYFDDMWSEVAFFYVGLKRELSDATLEKIFTFEKDGINGRIAKLLVGRLLQAGWHSETSIKYTGMQRAIDFAPGVRDDFANASVKTKIKIPKIISGFLVLALSEYSFGSGFLFKELKNLLKTLLQQTSKENIFKALAISWAIKKFLNTSEKKELTDTFLKKIPEIGKEEQASTLLLLRAINEKDKTMEKKIKSRLNKLRKSDPQIFQNLLPYTKGSSTKQNK